jgi:hypothetical protein
MPDHLTRGASDDLPGDGEPGTGGAEAADDVVRWDLLRQFFRAFARVESGGDPETLAVVDAVMRGAELGRRAAIVVKDDLTPPVDVVAWEREVLLPALPQVLAAVFESDVEEGGTDAA